MSYMNIGQRVRNAYGETGTIVDRMYSEMEKEYYYSVKFDNRDKDDGGDLLLAEELQKAEYRTRIGEYAVETEILDSVCVVIVYKMEKDKKVEIVRGHGHIIHEGDIGIVQALSYGFKKAYEKINSGEIGGQHYVK